MQPQRARAWLKTLATQSGLPEECRFHDLRHMWVSLLRAAGVSDEDVAKAAGHASPQVTMSMYAHAMTAASDISRSSRRSRCRRQVSGAAAASSNPYP